MPYAEANGKRFFYQRADATTKSHLRGLSILAIHGLGSTHSFYTPIFPRLTNAGFTCFAYDTYGSGLSVLSGRADEEQNVESMAKDALGLMDKLKVDVERTILIGHSMGGMVACQLASNHPFAGVVLLGPVHPNPGAAELFSERINVVNKRKSLPYYGMEAMADVIPKAATGSKSTPAQHAWIRALLLSQQPAGYISLCNVIAKATPPRYQLVRSSILLIAGAEDKSAPLSGCTTILESCATGDSAKKLEVLDGVGHWHCVEAPDDVGRLIEQFAIEL